MIDHFLWDHLSNEEKNKVFLQCTQQTFEHGQIIHPANLVRKGLHLIIAGTAEVYIPGQTATEDEVLEMVKEGEFLGLSQFHAFLSPTVDLEPSTLEVRAIDDVETLYIPFSLLDKLIAQPSIREKMLQEVSLRLYDVYQSLALQVKHNRKRAERSTIIQTIGDVMNGTPLILRGDVTIQKAVKELRANRRTAVLVVEQEQLKGIVTEQDFIERVLASGESTERPISSIMTNNLLTITPHHYTYEALTIMIAHGIKHLPVVHNGKVVGIVHLSHVIQKEQLFHVNELLSNVKEEQLPKMKHHLYEVLTTLVQQNVPTSTLLQVMNGLYDQLLEQCIKIVEEKLGHAPSRYVFYCMGSAGRREQFLLTDQDHFLVYEDEEDNEYFASFGEKIVELLESAGYKRCRGNMMASNEQWRGSLHAWQNRLRDWVLHATNDRLLLAQNFFSYRYITGDKQIHDRFVTIVEQGLDRAKIFLYRLSQHEREHPVPTLEQPIRAIFNMHRKEIDIKKQLLFPFHHSLQILSLMHNIVYGTPTEKLEALYEKKVISENFYKDLRASMEAVLSYYVKKRVDEYSAGKELTTTLELRSLTTREKEEWMLNIRLIKELQTYMLSYY